MQAVIDQQAFSSRSFEGHLNTTFNQYLPSGDIGDMFENNPDE